MARAAYNSSLCEGAAGRAACEALSGAGCSWGEGAGCGYSVIVSPQWMRGLLFCPGSLADEAAACALTVAGRTGEASGLQTRCTANPNCTWISASDYASNPFAHLLPEMAPELYSPPTAPNSNTPLGACVAPWVTSPISTAAVTLTADPVALGLVVSGLADPAILYPPIFDRVFGKCPGVARTKQILTANPCGVHKDVQACNAEPQYHCWWLPESVEAGAASSATGGAVAGGAGSCVIGPRFYMDLLYDPADPWVAAYNNASRVCSSKTASSACDGAGTITYDTAKLNSYGEVQPVYDNTATGGGGANNGTAAALAPGRVLVPLLGAVVAFALALG
ncbi:hypothetical protein HYH03_014292 [Edaphochlamys debaryana]|uniref:Uncharacterized protein n=1 Tax=Edaphochlamys debaryana TaxID=47281 RepID=A0A836BS29_9CHLO|nr:hypothetical protein HYH03_014292 [Edaphochlamys debaryana]|eukprot:KAG2487046.1 hypothetical protein HYH03_014292 [Edaphochlamys debaryana]